MQARIQALEQLQTLQQQEQKLLQQLKYNGDSGRKRQ